MSWQSSAVVTGLVVMLTGGGPASASGAETGWRTLTIRVYDGAGLSKAATREAMDVAARALSPASIEVSWVPCTRSSGGRCVAPLVRGEVIVRLVRNAGAADETSEEALGTALIDPVSGTGVLATIFVERVERMAQAGGMDMGTLLGRAMAHEIGHLLLGQSTHGISGLMRPRWTLHEVVRDARVDWRFAAPDVQAIRSREWPARP